MIKPLWEKLASGLIVPSVLHLHHPCCRGGSPPGPYCDLCSTGKAATKYLVEAEGIAADGCADCGDLDALLDPGVVVTENMRGCHGLSNPIKCGWRYDVSPSICDINDVSLCMFEKVPGPGFVVAVYLYAETGIGRQLYFRKDYVGAPDCENFNREAIAFDSQIDFGCDGTGATSYVTAL